MSLVKQQSGTSLVRWAVLGAESRARCSRSASSGFPLAALEHLAGKGSRQPPPPRSILVPTLPHVSSRAGVSTAHGNRPQWRLQSQRATHALRHLNVQRPSPGEHVRAALGTVSEFVAATASTTNHLDARPGNLFNLQKQSNFLDRTQGLMVCVGRSQSKP